MKLLFILLFFSTAFAKTSFTEGQIPRNSNDKDFYLTYDEFIISGVESRRDIKFEELKKKYLKSKRESPWVNVSIDELNVFGLKKDLKVVNVDHYGEKKEYVLQEKIDIYLIPNGFYNSKNPNEYDAYRTFYIHLKGTRPERDLDLVDQIDNADTIQGLAYIGTLLQLKASPRKEIEFNKENVLEDEAIQSYIKEKVPNLKFDIPNGITLNKTVLNLVRGKVENKVTQYHGGLIVKTADNKIFDFGPIKYPSEGFPGMIESFPIVEGAEWMILINDVGMHSCKTLYIYKENQLQVHKLFCDSGGC